MRSDVESKTRRQKAERQRTSTPNERSQTAETNIAALCARSPSATQQALSRPDSHTSSLLLLTLSNSASASPSFIHLCLQICSMESRLLGSKTSMWRIRCSHSAGEERGWVTRREGHNFCWRQPHAARVKALFSFKPMRFSAGSHTQQKYCFSFCTLHTCRFAADI